MGARFRGVQNFEVVGQLLSEQQAGLLPVDDDWTAM